MNEVQVIETPGRELCPRCGGDPGAPCMECGGTGLLPFSLPRCRYEGPINRCRCAMPLERVTIEGEAVWYLVDDGRLPLFRCEGGHEVALRFLPVPERSAA